MKSLKLFLNFTNLEIIEMPYIKEYIIFIV